jgi:hypothetical protein
MSRLLLGIIAAVALLATPAAPAAAANPFVGTWQTTTSVVGAGGMRMNVTIQIVFSPQGTYSELDHATSNIYNMMTRETGNYLLLAPNTLRLVVTNWNPKQQCGIVGQGCVPIRKPPGSALRYKFTSATTFTAQDVTFGNGPTVTYRKIQ